MGARTGLRRSAGAVARSAMRFAASGERGAAGGGAAQQPAVSTLISVGSSVGVRRAGSRQQEYLHYETVMKSVYFIRSGVCLHLAQSFVHIQTDDTY